MMPYVDHVLLMHNPPPRSEEAQDLRLIVEVEVGMMGFESPFRKDEGVSRLVDR